MDSQLKILGQSQNDEFVGTSQKHKDDSKDGNPILHFRGKGFLSDVMCLLGEHRKSLPGLLVLFIIGAGLDLAGLTVIGPYIGLITSPESDFSKYFHTLVASYLPAGIEPILALGWLLVAIFLIRLVALLFINFFTFRLSSRVDASLRISLLRRYQSLPYTQWLMRNTSEYLAAINQQVSSFIYGILNNGLRAAADCLAGVAVLVFLAYTDWRAFVIVAIVFSTFAIFYDRVFKTRLSRYGARQRQLTIAMNMSVQHAMEGLKELRVLGVEESFTQSMAGHANEYTKIQSRFNTIFNMPRYLAEFSLIFFIVCLVSIAELVLGRTDHIGTLVGIFGFAALRLMPAANSLMTFFTQARFQRATLRHLARDYRNLSPKSDHNLKRKPEDTEPFVNLTAIDLRFRYPTAKANAINGVSLTINKGEAIALIGPSGSGKTTLVDILLGLMEPQEGAIEVNGHPLLDNHRRLLDHVAYLPQHVFLIDDTLRANVAMGVNVEEIDDDLIYRALCQAQLEDLVERLPNGIHTDIGDRGLRLSGGQRQRVALARAFYHHKDVIIMDEATSALDRETERDIVNEINMLKGKTTLIVIAHRLTTIQECDRIYRLEDGRITQEGTYDEVIKNPTH